MVTVSAPTLLWQLMGEFERNQEEGQTEVEENASGRVEAMGECRGARKGGTGRGGDGEELHGTAKARRPDRCGVAGAALRGNCKSFAHMAGRSLEVYIAGG